MCTEYFDITIKILKVEHKQLVAPQIMPSYYSNYHTFKM